MMNYKPHELAKILGVSVKTLQRWDKSGKLPAKRTPTNYRYYTENDLLVAQGVKTLPKERKTVVYCRVSSSSQKSELKNQVKAMEDFCLNAGFTITETISEIGGGLNFKRKKFIEMIFSMIRGEISTIVVAHKDRLCRFAFDLIEKLAEYSDCRIIVVNSVSLSPQKELVEDLIAIIHYFSSRMDGSKSDSEDLNIVNTQQ